MDKIREIQIQLGLNGKGLVNFNGSSVPKRFVKQMSVNGKVSSNGSFAKEHIYGETFVDENGVKKEKKIYKKIISDNLLRKMIFGDENDINADKLCSIDKLRVAYLSQDNVIARGHCVLGRTDVDIKRKGGFCVTDAEQTNNVETWLETRTKEGERNDTSLFFKEKCGDIEYLSNILVDFRQLKFISIDENYDRVSLSIKDVEPFIKSIESRYGEGSAIFGNWGTTQTNLVGEEGIVLSDKVVLNILREVMKKILSINIIRSGSYAKTSFVKIALGYQGDEINTKHEPKFVEINSIKDYDMLMENANLAVNFSTIEAPVFEKVEKTEKKTKNK